MFECIMWKRRWMHWWSLCMPTLVDRSILRIRYFNTFRSFTQKVFVIVLLILLHVFYNIFHLARGAIYFSDRPQIPGCTPICRPISSAFIMTPIFTQIFHTQWPFFQNVNVMFQIFRPVCAYFKTFCQFSAEKTNLHPNWEVHTKKGGHLGRGDPIPNDPLLSTKLYTECPLFSSSGRPIPVIFIYSSAPAQVSTCTVDFNYCNYFQMLIFCIWLCVL